MYDIKFTTLNGNHCKKIILQYSRMLCLQLTTLKITEQLNENFNNNTHQVT